MADAQDDAHDELVRDLRAPACAADVTDERLAEAGVPLTVAGLQPSLHLNLAECHRKLGDLDSARAHVRAAESSLDALPDDEYRHLIRTGLRAVTDQLKGA